MSELLTAEQARAIANTITVAEHLKAILELVRRKSEAKTGNEVIYEKKPFSCYDKYFEPNPKGDVIGDQVIRKLKELGYKVDYYYSDGAFGTRMGLSIKW